MTTLELDQQLNSLIIQGKSVEALLTLYAEDVVAQENDEPERVGRESWIQGRQALEPNLTKFDARVLAHAASGDVLSEWGVRRRDRGMGAMKIHQVAVRHWKDGLVVRERFYHK